MRVPSMRVGAFWVALCLALFAVDAQAQVSSAGVLDSVLARYQAASIGWAGVITTAATWLFWCLATISLVWTGGMMALRRADLGEFFAEFFRFIMFVGFFWWLLINGPNFATSIYASLRLLGGNATGLGGTLTPSGVVDVGFAIFYRVIDQSSFWSPINSAVGIVLGAVILVILALVGVNMLLLLISGWILAYGGVFFLGFGGSRWTSDMAIGYFKTVLNVAAQLFAMVLIVGIGKTFLDDYFARMSVGITLKEMGVMLIVGIILLFLVNKVPAVIGGIASGAGVGGVGEFGAGSAMTAAGMAGAAAAAGGAMMAAGATSAAGGISALSAAFSKASQNVAAGSDVLASFAGSGGGGGSSAGKSEAGTGSTPFADAAGFGGSPAADTSAGSTSTGQPNGSGEGESNGDAGADAGSGSAEAQAGEGADESTGDAGSTSAGEAAHASAGGAGQAGAGGAGQAGADTESGADSQAETSAPAPAPASPGMLASAASALAKGGRIAADAGANLAKGTADVAKAKAGRIRESARQRIAETTGGKIAAAIRSQGGPSADGAPDPAPTFAGNSLAGADTSEVDRDGEISAFVNKDEGNNGTTG